MTAGARLIKWGLGLFIFGVFLTFGIVAHYCSGARWPTGEVFMKNVTLWWACPWTLSVAAVQAGGLGMVALRFRDIASLYQEVGQCVARPPQQCVGIRWDYAFFQMLIETNYLIFLRARWCPGECGGRRQ